MKYAMVLTVALASLGACTGTTREHVETAVADILLPVSEERQLGVQVHNELSRQVQYINDPTVTSYVQNLTTRVLAAAKRDRPDLSAKVYVIDDPKTVNAFATPGERLYVFTGLLMAAQSDAEVAGVIAHECGHIVARHPARQMVNTFGLQALSAMILGRNPSLLESLGANVASKGFLLANSRADETVADEYGARYASAAGFDPRALGSFLTAISAKSGEPSGVMAWLSDHPTTPDRVAHLEEYIAENNLQRGREGQQIAEIKTRLRDRATGSAYGGGPAGGAGGGR